MFARLPDYDPETNEYNTANRHYTPMGRWMSPDPSGVKAASLDDPQTWNMYAYARNNPTTVTDPSGLSPQLAGGSEIPSPIDAAALRFWDNGGLGPQVESEYSREELAAVSQQQNSPQWTPTTVTLHAGSPSAITLTIYTSPTAQGGGPGMTILVYPTACDNCGWMQTVNASNEPHAHVDFKKESGSANDPARVLGYTNGTRQNVLYDSPQFKGGTTNGSKQFVSTIGYMEGGKFHPEGSITWGFTLAGGKVTPATPRESRAREQAGSFGLIRREYPGVLANPQ